MIEHKNRPPFGNRTKRFYPIGYHPVFETRPGTFKYPNISPGCYDSKIHRKIISKVPRWKRQQETEEFSRRHGYRGDRKLKELQWIKSINGPGWQDIPSDPLKFGIAFTKSSRFPIKKPKSFGVPGPGTYGKIHNPFLRHEEKSHAKGFSFSNVPSFEQYSYASRGLVFKDSHNPPPNLYKIKSCTEELLSKKVSRRGPYQIFTVVRFPGMTVNNNLQPLSPYKNPLSLSHPNNHFKGKFYRCGKDSVITSRLVLKDKGLIPKKGFDVGPGTYDPYPARAFSQARAPFNSSVLEVRPAPKCGLSPPPGRYSPKTDRTILGNGMRSAFISKTKREVIKVKSDSWF